MGTQYANQVRLGGVALGVSSLLILLAQVIRPAADTGASPQSDPMGAANLYASKAFELSNVLLIIAFTLLILGVCALYSHLARSNISNVNNIGIVGMVLSLFGIGLFLPFAGVFAFAFPAAGTLYLQGQKDALDIALAVNQGPGVPMTFFGLALIALGSILFALAITQSSSLPRTAGILYGIGYVLFFFTNSFGHSFEVFDALVITVAGLWLGMSIWRHEFQNEHLEQQ